MVRVIVFIAIAILFNTTAVAVAEKSEPLIPFNQEHTDYSEVWVVIGLFLTLVVVLGYGISKYLPGSLLRQHRVGKNIEVIESRRISPKTALFIVRIDKQRMLVIESGDKTQIMDLQGGELNERPEPKC